MNKKILLDGLLIHLEKELSVLTSAAINARAASIDEQSIAETQYDTLAIEAGYLAEGQAKRAQEIKIEIKQLNQLSIPTYQKNTSINNGALVQLNGDNGPDKFYFMAPAGAGYRMKLGQHIITVITPLSPLGASMFQKQVGDEVHLRLANKTLSFEIVAVY